MGTILTNQNYIQEEVKSRLTSGNACHHSVQNLLSSGLLSKSWKIKICRIIILPVVLYGCETWSFKKRKERSLRVFQNRVLWKIFGPKGDEVTGSGESYIMRSFNDLYSSPNIVRVIKSRRMRRAAHIAYGGKERCLQSFGGET